MAYIKIDTKLLEEDIEDIKKLATGIKDIGMADELKDYIEKLEYAQKRYILAEERAKNIINSLYVF